MPARLCSTPPALAAIGLSFLVSACPTDDVATGTEFFLIAVSPTSATVMPGGSFTVTVEARAASPSDVDLTLVLTGGAAFPPPIAAFAPVGPDPDCGSGGLPEIRLHTYVTQLNGYRDECTYTVNVGASAPPEDYVLHVRGRFTSYNRLDDSNPFTLSVPDATPQFSLGVSGGDQLPDGGQLPLTVTITRNPGFTSPVDLHVRQPLTPILPPGITAAFSPNPVPAGSSVSTLTLTNNGAAVGDHALQVDGLAAGSGNVTTDFSVTVLPPVPTSGWLLVHTPSVPIVDVDFPTSSIGYAIGTDFTTNIALKSVDGGRTWAPLTLPPSGTPLTSVHFPTATTGFIVGRSNTLLKTTDGGATWNDIGNAIPFPLYVQDVFFLDELTGFVGGGGGSQGEPPALFSTTNGGATWTQRSGPWESHPGNAIRAIRFLPLSPADGYVAHLAVNAIAPVHHTTDGGTTWTPGTGAVASFRNFSGGFAVAGNAEVYSWSGGAGWTSLGAISLPGVTPPSFLGVSSQNGVLWVAGNRSPGYAVIARQVPGGWQADFDGINGIPGDVVAGLNDIVMFSTTEGVAVGVNAILRRFP
jgi:photosystem II stability/assembly factor-like uncharacterized protein